MACIKVLEQDASVMESYPVDVDGIVDRSYEKDIINEKYDFIDEVIEEVLVNKSEKEERTDRIDRYMTGKWLGLPIFLVIMALVFFLTFTVGDWLKGYFETGLDLLTGAAGTAFEAAGVSPVIESLIVDGIISGVGGILTFLPNIFILFLALAFLEDSGYMARVAFVMDDIMGTSWPLGKSFPSDASWIRLLCARDHGVQGAGTQEGPSEDDSCDAVYVLQCETSDLRAVLLHVFRKIRDGGVLFHVSSRNRGCDPDSVHPVEGGRKQGGE